MRSELHHNIDIRRGVSPAAATTDNTAWVSQIVDTVGYDACEFIILTGSLGDADATFTVLVEDGATANLSDAAPVADQYLLGLESEASFTFAADDKVRKIGYVGMKRYLRVTINPANNTGNAFVAGAWLLGSPRVAPTANPPI